MAQPSPLAARLAAELVRTDAIGGRSQLMVGQTPIDLPGPNSIVFVEANLRSDVAALLDHAIAEVGRAPAAVSRPRRRADELTLLRKVAEAARPLAGKHRKALTAALAALDGAS